MQRNACGFCTCLKLEVCGKAFTQDANRPGSTGVLLPLMPVAQVDSNSRAFFHVSRLDE
jgi:hypothetical protein